MSGKKVTIISPECPTGTAWLINCFLELGVYTYRAPQERMWEASGGRFFLRSDEAVLKQWLPALSAHADFEFRSGIEVEWAHDWPLMRHRGSSVIFFTRDPRDAILSYYRRIQPEQTFREFVEFLDPRTLLNRMENWRLYHWCWWLRGDFRSFRFEDYKEDAFGLLTRILRYVKLDVDARRIRQAVEASTFEKAVAAERKYLEDHPGNRLVNRSGTVGQWRDQNDIQETAADIAGRVSDVMQAYGYTMAGFSAPPVLNRCLDDYAAHFKSLSFLRSIDVPVSADLGEPNPRAGRLFSNALDFAKSLDENQLRRAGLQSHEIPLLKASIAEFLSYARVPA